MALEYIAMMRANALIDLRIARPLRWLASKSAEPELTDWSPVSMGLVFEKLENLCERAAEDGNVLLDPYLDIFADIARTQPLFREYLDHTYNQEVVRSPDGKTKHLAYRLALAEILSPSDASNTKTTPLTIEYLGVQLPRGA